MDNNQQHVVFMKLFLFLEKMMLNGTSAVAKQDGVFLFNLAIEIFYHLFTKWIASCITSHKHPPSSSIHGIQQHLKHKFN